MLLNDNKNYDIQGVIGLFMKMKSQNSKLEEEDTI
jgi:hypothetical protein